MNDHQKNIVRKCLEGAEGNTMTFPRIVGTLMEAGIESYAVDLRRSLATYFLPDGSSTELKTHTVDIPVAPEFDTARLQAAIKEAQQQVPGYSYIGFCKKAASAGCSGYIVSIRGRRALYISRSAETHVEHFPN